MEYYYLPSDRTLTDDSLFSVSWVGGDYLVFDGCPDRESTKSASYFRMSPWGFTVDVGTTDLGSDSKLLVSDGCFSSSPYDIATVGLSRSVLAAPNFSPYEPFYFFGFFALSIFIFFVAWRTLFGAFKL